MLFHFFFFFFGSHRNFSSTHTYTQIHISYTDAHTHTHINARTRTHTYTQKYTHIDAPHTRTQRCTSTDAHVHTYTNTLTHSRTINIWFCSITLHVLSLSVQLAEHRIYWLYSLQKVRLLPHPKKGVSWYITQNCRGCPRGVMVKAMDCRLIVSEFELQSRCNVHFLDKYP